MRKELEKLGKKYIESCGKEDKLGEELDEVKYREEKAAKGVAELTAEVGGLRGQVSDMSAELER